MTRQTLQRLLLAIVALLTLGSIAEAAAPARTTRHRTRHSTRVTLGGPTIIKKTTKHRRHVVHARAKRRKAPRRLSTRRR